MKADLLSAREIKQSAVYAGTRRAEPAAPLPGHTCPQTTLAYIAPTPKVLCQQRRVIVKQRRFEQSQTGYRRRTRSGSAKRSGYGAQTGDRPRRKKWGCSRPIAEGENWMERRRYIGVSGVLLKSDLYLTLGISGQIHMVVETAQKLLSQLSKDKLRTFFNYADYGLVGDNIYKVVPALIDQLSAVLFAHLRRRYGGKNIKHVRMINLTLLWWAQA